MKHETTLKVRAGYWKRDYIVVNLSRSTKVKLINGSVRNVRHARLILAALFNTTVFSKCDSDLLISMDLVHLQLQQPHSTYFMFHAPTRDVTFMTARAVTKLANRMLKLQAFV